MYIKNNNSNIVLYDVDDTLVMWEPFEGSNALELHHDGYVSIVYPNEREIKSLKEAKIRGHYVRVNSQGGQDWAELVVQALNLERYVDSIECKPKWYHDDLPADTWMKRFYKEPVKGDK